MNGKFPNRLHSPALVGAGNSGHFEKKTFHRLFVTEDAAPTRGTASRGQRSPNTSTPIPGPLAMAPTSSAVLFFKYTPSGLELYILSPGTRPVGGADARAAPNRRGSEAVGRSVPTEGRVAERRCLERTARATAAARTPHSASFF